MQWAALRDGVGDDAGQSKEQLATAEKLQGRRRRREVNTMRRQVKEQLATAKKLQFRARDEEACATWTACRVTSVGLMTQN